MAKERTFYVDRDGRLSETASADTPQSERTPTSAAKRLTEKLDAAARKHERSEYEMDVYEVLRDAELGRLSDALFCPVCRSELPLGDASNSDDATKLICEVCGFRGPMSQFNVQ